VPFGKLNFDIEDKYRDVRWYSDHFVNKPHSIFLVVDNHDPLFIAVDTQGEPPYLSFSFSFPFSFLPSLPLSVLFSLRNIFTLNYFGYKLLVRSVSNDERLYVLDYSKKYISKVLELDNESVRAVSKPGSLKKRGNKTERH